MNLYKVTEKASFFIVAVLLAFLIVFLPLFDFEDIINPRQTSPFIIFSYTIPVLLIFFFLERIRRKISFSVSVPDILLVVLFIWILMNRYLIQAEYNFSIRFYELCGLAVLYCVIRRLDKLRVLLLLYLIVLGGIVQAIFGQLQLFGLLNSNHVFFRITGGFQNPGPYSGHLASVFPVALGLFLFHDHITRRLNGVGAKGRFDSLIKGIPIVALLTILLVLPASQSRASWLGVTGSSIFLLFVRYNWKVLFHRYLSTRMRKVAAISAITLISVIILASLYFFKKDSGNGRLLVWKASLNMIKDKPFTGHGFDRFSSHYMGYQGGYFRINPDNAEEDLADSVEYAFNELLQITVENGVGALILVLLVVGFVLGRRTPNSDRILLLCKAALISMIIFSFFSYPAQVLPIKINAVVMLALLVRSSVPFFKVAFSYSNNTLYRALGAACVLILLIIISGVYQRAGKIYRALQDWDIAFRIYNSGSYDGSLRYYEAALPVFENEGSFLTNYGKALSMNGDHQKAVEVLEKAQLLGNNVIVQTALGDSYKALKQFGRAEQSYKNAHYMIPLRFYPLYLLARLYHENGQKKKAAAIAKALLQKKIKVNSLAIKEMRSEMRTILGSDEK